MALGTLVEVAFHHRSSTSISLGAFPKHRNAFLGISTDSQVPIVQCLPSPTSTVRPAYPLHSVVHMLRQDSGPRPLVQLEDDTAPSPTLPIEVLEEVINQVSGDSGSLRDLSLLCKAFLPRTRFWLFAAITIRNVAQMESSHEFLDAHPWVPPLVRKVTLESRLGRDYRRPNIPLLDIFRVHLFTRLPHLRTWGLNAYVGTGAHLSLHRSTLVCYRTYGRHIQELELAGIPFQDVSHFSQLVSAFTALRNLICADLSVQKELQSLSILRKPSKLLKIQHLSVSILDNFMYSAKC